MTKRAPAGILKAICIVFGHNHEFVPKHIEKDEFHYDEMVCVRCGHTVTIMERGDTVCTLGNIDEIKEY